MTKSAGTSCYLLIGRVHDEMIYDSKESLKKIYQILPQRLHIDKSSFLGEIIFKKVGSHSHQAKIGDTNLYKGKHLLLT